MKPLIDLLGVGPYGGFDREIWNLVSHFGNAFDPVSISEFDNLVSVIRLEAFFEPRS